MPGPVTRMLREPTRAVAVVLLAVTALASAGIQSAAAAMLQATVDANWRGAYDILVTPADAMKPIGGLLPPNTLTSSVAGMTMKDLAKVRKVAGVGIAAPIGEILVPGMHPANAELTIPADVVAAARTAPQAFGITETFSTNDGLGERVITSNEFTLVVDDTRRVLPSELARCMANKNTSTEGRFGQYQVDGSKYPLIMREICQSSLGGGQLTVVPKGQDPRSGASGIPIANDTTSTQVGLPVNIQNTTRITLVDPKAEKQLLGTKGDFLDPLLAAAPSSSTGIQQMLAWAKSAGTPYATKLLNYLAGMTGSASGTDDIAEYRALFEANGDDYDKYLASLNDSMRLVPLVISRQPVSKVSVKLDLTSLGTAKAVGVTSTIGPRTYDLPTSAQAEGARVGTSAGDISGLMNPFVGAAGSLSWPGTNSGTPAPDSSSAVGLLASVSHPLPSWYRNDSRGITLAPSGYQATAPASVDGSDDPSLSLKGDANPRAIGSESVYNGGTDPAPDDKTIGATLSVPVGSFDPAKVADEDAPSYVPLGAYGAVSSTLVSGPNAGVTMQPSVTGLGLVSSRTAAIASINSAGTWGDAAPIDAIRVRVAGIAGYSADAQRKVIDVAHRIQDLGFDATVVAGSSPTATDVKVAGYAFGTANAAGKQHVGTLGSVTQNWSELGAASRVSLSVGAGTYAILGIGVIAAMLLLGASLLIGIPMRRDQSATMRLVGFTRPHIVRWHAAEEVPGLAITALVGVIAITISGGNGLTTLVVAVAVVAMAAASALTVVAGSAGRARSGVRDVRSRRLGAGSVVGFGARQTLVHPLSSVLGGAAYLVVGLATAALIAVVVTTREGAGHSLLATLTLGRVLAPQIALGAAGIVGGVMLARLIRRIDLSGRDEQWAVLRAAGWTGREVATAQRIEVLTVALPAVALTAAAAWSASSLAGLPVPAPSAIIAAAAASLTAVLTAAIRTKEVRR